MRRMSPTQRRGKDFKNIAVYRPGKGWEDNKGQRRKSVWVHISVGYIYLSYSRLGHGLNRTYWVLTNISPRTRPRITFAEKTNTMKIGTYKIRFARPADLDFARACLAPFSRQE
jgi:hypothetical protein